MSGCLVEHLREGQKGPFAQRSCIIYIFDAIFFLFFRFVTASLLPRFRDRRLSLRSSRSFLHGLVGSSEQRATNRPRAATMRCLGRALSQAAAVAAAVQALAVLRRDGRTQQQASSPCPPSGRGMTIS